jgi:iron complex transport system substrate-binding protein
MSDRIKIKYLILVVLLITILLGCNKSPEITESENKNNVSDDSFQLTLTDQIGREVTIEALPERIVSLAPSNTEILFALGLEDKIVGVTDYCNYPEAAKFKDKVGGYSEPNIEKIVSLRPDLILGTDIHQKAIEELETLGVPSVVIEPEDFD